MTRDPLPPVLLSEVRSLGFPVILTCPVCVHTGIVQLSSFAGLPEVGCGRQVGASARPHHRLWIAHLRQTGQRHRFHYWTSLMPVEARRKRASGLSGAGGVHE